MVDGSNIPKELQDKILKWEANAPANQQLQAIRDLSDSFEQLVVTIEKGLEKGDNNQQQLGSLFVDIRNSLGVIKDKKDPETPDFSQPIVDTLKGLETAVMAATRVVPDFKPNIMVDAPQVSVSPPDLAKVEKIMSIDLPKAFKTAIGLIPTTEIPETDFSPIIETLTEMSSKLDSIDIGTRLKPLPGSVSISNPTTNPANVQEVSPSTSVVTFVGDSIGSIQVIESNPARIEVEFFNTGTGFMYLLKGSGDASVSNLTVSLEPNGWYRTSFKGEFNAIWTSDSSGGVLITESTL